MCTKENQSVLSPSKIPDLEYTALKSKNEVLKTLLTFEREYLEKLGTLVDLLMTETQNLKPGNLKRCCLQLKTEKNSCRKN